MYNKEFSDLLVEKRESVLILTLDNESMANAITDSMIDSIETVLAHADEDDEIRCIILTGAGIFFCAGGDIKAMESKSGMFAGESNELRRRYNRGIQRIPRAIESLKTPIIAMVGGAAIGAGCDLAMMCDLRVSSERAKFAETFSKLSLVPGDGGTFFLQRVVGYTKAMEMFLTGDIYSGEQVKEMGLSNYQVSHDTLLDFTLSLANKIASNAPIALSLTKMALKSGRTSSLNDQLELLSTMQGISQRTADHFEGICAFKEKREAKFTGK
ncbi:3-hxdroxyacyl-CoA dehydrogenase [Halobacteriovorax marinus]|uniref:enoyl-CoA hydratase-related protein n=1 Tax=Halobacteriovorax marinus TaxID=97084 RepID=UPI000BC34ECE|nr:enoyl-CoA hydratase-related protein [Halobacteriovorax marinus]ATH08141.1 3-hxdroxyacyl-CoA dehydrogenase [Halobacteriovorax marinus]